MPNIEEWNGFTYCTKIDSLNLIGKASITSIDFFDTSCESCNERDLSPSDISCGRACIAPCVTFYTNVDSGTALQVGDFIYENSECSCETTPENTYYADKCGGRSGQCYTIDPEDCSISSISSC